MGLSLRLHALWAPAVAVLLAMFGQAAWGQQAGEPKGWRCDRSRADAPVLLFRGPIGQGEADRFRQAWRGCYPAGYRGTHTVDLNSGGGVVTEALTIARLLVEAFRNGPPLLLTRVSGGSRCVSACTYLFVAGQRRVVEPRGTLEPHGFSSFLGEPVDLVLPYVAKKVAESNKPPCEVAKDVDEFAWMFRLRAAGKAYGRALTDPRLAWVQPFLDIPKVNCAQVVRLLSAYLELPPERQRLVAWLDSVMRVTLPEVERAAALRAFRARFGASGGGPATADDDALLDRPEGHVRWALEAALEGINAYLDRARQGPRLKDVNAAADDVRAVHQALIDDAAAEVSGDLGTYMTSRQQDIDVPSFIKLMFSTSILYTRPVSREELCDHNLMNVGCE